MPFSETAKIRPYIWPYIKNGSGIDLGCELDRVHPECIGMDAHASAAVDIVGDITDLSRFKDENFDWVFSSHAIEDILNFRGALEEWYRVLKSNGYLIVYCPYRLWYPNVGQPGANINHVHDFVPSDIVNALREIDPDIWIVTAEIRGHKRQNEFNEYSCLVIAKKSAPMNPHFFINNHANIGDTLSVTPLCKILKEKFDCKITVAHDTGNILDKNLVDYIGQEKIPYDMIIHQAVNKTEHGDWLRRSSHFTQFTARVCAETLPAILNYLPNNSQQPVDMIYDIKPCDFIYDCKKNIELPDKFVCISMETYPPRTWIKSEWEKVIEWFNNNNIAVVLLGTKSSSISGGFIDLRGKLTITQSVAVLSKASMLVSIDTCFVHFAELLRIPAVVLMGPSYHKTTFSTSIPVLRNDNGCSGCYNWLNHQTQYEWNPDLIIPNVDRVIGPEPYITGNELPLYVLNDCKDYMTGVQCMKEIQLEDVISAISGVLPTCPE